MEIEYDKDITIRFFFCYAWLSAQNGCLVRIYFCRSIHIQVSLNVNTKLLRLRAYQSDYRLLLNSHS